MAEKISSDHPLIKMFRRSTKRAFQCYPELYDQDISDHICMHILSEFVKADRLYCITDEKGHSLEEIPDMLIEGDVMCHARSLEREMMVQEHIGDFSLFMAGFFPHSSSSPNNRFRVVNRKDRLFMELYIRLYPSERGIDYYILQGKKAYEKASRIYKGLNDIKAALLKKLARRFDAYACLMQTIQDYLLSPSINTG